MNIIETENLTKRFKDTTALEGVSINVREGEIYGFLGLNGAGKTTTIRLLLGMIKPDEGIVSLFGQRAEQASRIWNDVGYLVETPYSYPDLTVKENLEVCYRLRGLKDKKQIDTIIKVLQLEPYKDKKAKYLSLGNGQRLGLAKALIHRPRLLILDEPINGLDPAGIVEIREFLKELVRNNHTTIFLSSHILSEISKVATRIGIVHQGRLIKEINTNELDQQVIKKLMINTSDNHKALQAMNIEGYKAKINGSGYIETTENRAVAQPEILSSLLVNSGFPPKMIYVDEEDLEAYFLRIIGNENFEA
ncbi:MAG TPA: ABC transporter ATP-binding protein [Prolixibacteraceae bacterium]|nr:ABC transporter ATP-binding protein [Prolixibacteraceae bacterium]